MSGTTEIGLFPLKAGLNVHDSSNPAYKIWRDAMSTVLAQPGARRASYGMELENPSNLRLYVEWNKVQDHIDFTQSAAYAPMIKNLEPLFASDPILKHIAPKPFPSTPLSPNVSGALEVFTAYFPAEISQADQDSYTDKAAQFVEKALKKSSDFTGMSSGWSLENDMPNPHKDGKKSKLFIAFIGWTSKDGHLQFVDTATFKDNIALLANGPESMEKFHIKPEELQAGLA